MSTTGAEIDETWVGDFELELHDSPWDELASILPVQETIAAYYREVG